MNRNILKKKFIYLSGPLSYFNSHIIVLNRMLNQVEHAFSCLFLEKGLTHIAYNVITYLDIQTLYSIIDDDHQSQVKNQEIKTKNKKFSTINKSAMKQMIKNHLHIKEHLNKGDRSMYYCFYEQPEFIESQKQFIQQIITQATSMQKNKQFYSNFSQFQNTLKCISDQGLMEQCQVEQLKRILVDPCIPLPNMKRQNQGIYCNSSFQLFLVGLRFSQKHSEQQFSQFDDLKQKILSQQETYLKVFLQIQKQKNSNQVRYKNLHLVRYAPYEITHQNSQALILSQHGLHNLIVKLFVLTDVLLDSIVKFVSLIQDPFYYFLQVMSRYSMFRSFVIQLEESLGFLFQIYDTLYTDAIRDPFVQSFGKKPKFCFWKPAMTKWFIKMNPMHQKTNQVYFVLLTKLREDELLSQLQSEEQSQPWKCLKDYSIYLKNSLETNGFASRLKGQAYCHFTSNSQSPISQFIKKSPQTVQSLVFEYVEYITDLTINDQTVHWCGHSNHCLQSPFKEFNVDFKEYNRKYLVNLKQCIPNTLKPQTREELYKKLIQQEIGFLESQNVKPITLRQIIQEINSELQQDYGKVLQSQAQNATKIIKQNQATTNITGQNDKASIFMDFLQKDRKLAHFNQKAKINSSIQGQQKYFFSIPPLLSVQQIIMKSIDTKESSQHGQNDANSSFQYVSDDQGQEFFKESVQKKIHQKKSIQSMLTSITTNKDQSFSQNLRFESQRFQKYDNEQKSHKQQEILSFQSDLVKVQVNLDDEDMDDSLNLKKKLSSSCRNKNF